MRAILACAVAVLALSLGARPTDAAGVPDRDAALAAWNAFRADPVRSLDRTQPFLDFVSGSGEIHIVLNDHLLAWMYAPLDPEVKAVLYAAFLGANMASQLERGETGSDNVGAMAGALDAYGALREERPDLAIPLFDHLAEARADGRFAAAVKRIAAGEGPP